MHTYTCSLCSAFDLECSCEPYIRTIPEDAVVSGTGFPIGHKFWSGQTHTEDTKAKIGSYHKGKIVSEETKAKQSAAAKKRGMSWLQTPEMHAKQSAGRLGQKRTPEARQKMREAALRRCARKREANL